MEKVDRQNSLLGVERNLTSQNNGKISVDIWIKLMNQEM